MKLVYFAWVRERIGRSEEERSPPPTVKTVGELLGWLKTLGEEYENALVHPASIRVALDRQHADHDQPLGAAREVALFPPMTGG
ncbi:MAG: molybdopterin converting factor subunit 1 [Phyllobacteriaceae bacterium]|nr:molybdopterin converting factor subunit 1 [Phyllobacteriaceae bacterium]